MDEKFQIWYVRLSKLVWISKSEKIRFFLKQKFQILNCQNALEIVYKAHLFMTAKQCQISRANVAFSLCVKVGQVLPDLAHSTIFGNLT